MVSKNKFLKMIDWVAIIVSIFVVIAIIYKATDGNIDPSSVKSTTKKIGYTLKTVNYDIGMLEHIKEGDIITESKQNFPLQVKNVEIVPNEEDQVVFFDGGRQEVNLVGQGYAIVTIEGEIEAKGSSFMLGKQEISAGNNIFLESRHYKFSSKILKVEEIND